MNAVTDTDINADLYSVLGVPKNSSPVDIKKAYKSLILKYHPDKNKEVGTTKRFREIRAAYEILIDPKKRAEHDMLDSTNQSKFFSFLKQMLSTNNCNDSLFSDIVKMFYGNKGSVMKDYTSFNFDKIFNTIYNQILKKATSSDDPVNMCKMKSTVFVIIQTTLHERYNNLFKKIGLNNQIYLIPCIENEVRLDNIVFKVNCPDDFEFSQINSSDLLCTKVISLYEYLYGGSVVVNCYGSFQITIPFNSLIDDVPMFRFEGKGLPKNSDADTTEESDPAVIKRGDLIVLLTIDGINSTRSASHYKQIMKDVIFDMFPPISTTQRLLE